MSEPRVTPQSVFAGHAMLTVSLVWAMVPCVGPWDIAYGKAWDVLQHGWKLIMMVRRRVLRFGHCGTPCVAFGAIRFKEPERT